MRTTLTIDDDILAAAKEMAQLQSISIGEVISDLARRSLMPTPIFTRSKSGVPQLPVRVDGQFVTSELVRKLDAELP